MQRSLTLFSSLATGLLLAVVASGCASDSATVDAGNTELGIARFSVTETADRTTLIGVDASGAEVGHLELLHGHIAVWPEFSEQFEGSTADGRSVDVVIADQRYRWETLGYAPVMSLPAIPSRYAKLGMFLEDPHVVEVLDRWQVGFEPFKKGSALEGETAYTSTTVYVSDNSGTGGTGCTNCTSLGSVRGKTINTCNNNGPAAQVGKIYVGGTYSQWILDQMCAGSYVGDLWDPWTISEKTCSETGSDSQCGSTTGACAGCGIISTANPNGDNDEVAVWWSDTRLISRHTQYYPIP